MWSVIEVVAVSVVEVGDVSGVGAGVGVQQMMNRWRVHRMIRPSQSESIPFDFLRGKQNITRIASI